MKSVKLVICCFAALSLLELGSVFERADRQDRENRHIALVLAQRGKQHEHTLYDRLKGTLEGWAWQRFARPAEFVHADAAPDRPWEHPHRTAEVRIAGQDVGRLSVVDMALRRAMDEHLTAWAVAWAELRLSGLERLAPLTESLDDLEWRGANREALTSLCEELGEEQLVGRVPRWR